MTSKELKRLSRKELLEMLIEQEKENIQLREQLDALKSELASKELKINNAGSIAEAALQLNGVFAAAEEATRQYLANLKLIGDQDPQLLKPLADEYGAYKAKTQPQKTVLPQTSAPVERSMPAPAQEKKTAPKPETKPEQKPAAKSAEKPTPKSSEPVQYYDDATKALDKIIEETLKKQDNSIQNTVLLPEEIPEQQTRKINVKRHGK